MFYACKFSSVKHGFFTRNGGVSTAPFDSLNFANKIGERTENIHANIKIALNVLHAEDKQLALLNQVHSATIKIVHTPWQNFTSQSPEADGMITQNPHIALGIMTADCLPVLLHDPITQTIAAIHAGWRGIAGGIIENCVRNMIILGSKPNNIHAMLGPCISQTNYEVGEEVKTQCIARNPELKQSFTQSADKWLFDLQHAASTILQLNQVIMIDTAQLDTYQNREDFFSYRRSKHHNELYGCQASIVALELNDMVFY